MLRFLQISKSKPVHACFSWSPSSGFHRTACGVLVEKRDVETFSFEDLVHNEYSGICISCMDSIKRRVA